MKHIGLLAVVLSACAPGTYHGYSSSQPQYAQATTTTETTSEDGTTTSTSTETATYEAYPAAQTAAYDPPPPPPPAYEEPAPAPSSATRCHRKDTPDMCIGLGVLLDVGAIIKNHENASCRDASRALNRYADGHARELQTFATLDQTHSEKQLRGFQKRHEGEASLVIGAALELDSRCEGDHNLDRALQRVGFSGLIGSPVL